MQERKKGNNKTDDDIEYDNNTIDDKSIPQRVRATPTPTFNTVTTLIQQIIAAMPD